MAYEDTPFDGYAPVKLNIIRRPTQDELYTIWTNMPPDYRFDNITFFEAIIGKYNIWDSIRHILLTDHMSKVLDESWRDFGEDCLKPGFVFRTSNGIIPHIYMTFELEKINVL